MLEPDSFSSVMAATMIRYLQHKRALGRQYTWEGHTLRNLDKFLDRSKSSDLNAAAFLSWCDTQRQASGVRRNNMRIVRNFCLYRQRTQPTCYVPPTSLFPPKHQRKPAFIFTEVQIGQILEESQRLYRVRHSPLRREAMRLAITLLYCAGLRLGELLRLEVDDYEPKERLLSVRGSKFHKSRQLPLSADAAAEVERYLVIRRELGEPTCKASKLVWNGSKHANGYGRGRFCITMRQLLDRAGIRGPDGRRPTIHCLRHTFAAHALLRWYRDGVEVQSKLPQLATYMGHVSIASTQTYLHFAGELMSATSDRFAACSAKFLGVRSGEGHS